MVKQIKLLALVSHLLNACTTPDTLLVKVLNRLNANIIAVPYQNVIELKNEPNPLLSRWTTWKINFYPLVIPLRRLGRF